MTNPAISMIISSTHFEGVAFVGRKRQPIRELSGFDKTRHKIPQQSDDYSSRFVSEIANLDLEKDLESVYQNLRAAFKLKRVELQRSNPAPGCGSIITPHFTYAMSVSQSPEAPAVIVWERSVLEIKTPDQILTRSFAQVFDGKFDRIEFTLGQPFELVEWIDHVEALEDDRLHLNYDSQATICKLGIDNVEAAIEVSDSVVAVVHKQLARTEEILTSFLEAKRTIVDSFASQ